MNADTGGNKGGRPRKYPSDLTRPTITFRARSVAQEKLKASAALRELSLSEEVERRIELSFDTDAEIRDLEDDVRALRERDRLLWPTESDRVLGRMLGFALSGLTASTGFGWREVSIAPSLISIVVKNLMHRYVRSDVSLYAELFKKEQIEEKANSITKSVIEALGNLMPETIPHTNRIRSLATFRRKSTGEVLEQITISESTGETTPYQSPEFQDAVERYRPIRDEIELETTFVHVVKGDDEFWNRASARQTEGTKV